MNNTHPICVNESQQIRAHFVVLDNQDSLNGHSFTLKKRTTNPLADCLKMICLEHINALNDLMPDSGERLRVMILASKIPI